MRIRIIFSAVIAYIGTYPSRVDDKGRLVFPAPFKKSIPDGGDKRFVIKKSLYDNCLEMWPYPEWEKETDKIRDSLDFFNPAHLQFWRQYMLGCNIVEPDPKFGRISIPKYLLDAIGVNREVVFFGVNFRLEIWAEQNFGSSQVPTEDFVAIARSLSRK